VRASIKAFLMDQRRVAGLGNIYVAEALLPRGIHPAAARPRACARAPELLAAIRAALEGGIARRGTTLRDYVDADGRSGDNAAALLVYGRAGEPCPPLRRAIKRRVDAGGRRFFAALPETLRLRRVARIPSIWVKILSPRCRSGCASSRPVRADDRARSSISTTVSARSASAAAPTWSCRCRSRRCRGARAPGARQRQRQEVRSLAARGSRSTNGTFVGGERLKPGIKLPLAGRHGDQARRDQVIFDGDVRLMTDNGTEIQQVELRQRPRARCR
jgi:hypothetical protein